jgi:pheromone shutdown protein TraB
MLFSIQVLEVLYLILFLSGGGTAFSPIPSFSRSSPTVVVPPKSSYNHNYLPLRSTNDNDNNNNNNNNDSDSDEDTVTTVATPLGHIITLIGTAHLSKASNAQVQRLIEELQPNIVMVELDPTRLHRIGIANIDAIDNRLEVVTSEDIVLPVISDIDNTPWFLKPIMVVQDLIVEGFTVVTRALLTGAYKDMSKEMNNDGGGGGEFRVAIRAAENCTACHTLILGDRSSVTTIRRAAGLAMKSGDPLGVLKRLEMANAVEMEQLEERVRNDLLSAKKRTIMMENNENGRSTETSSSLSSSSEEIDKSEVQIAMMETLKSDSNFREGLFRKLEQEVPEFTQAFLKERDYIMSESIRRALTTERCSSSIQRVVGVVGLAHVSGMQATLEAMFSNQTIPLLLLREENR